jgi:CBS domain-containing protein
MMIDQWLYTHLGIGGDPVLLASVFSAHAEQLLRAGLGVDPDADEPISLQVHVGTGETGGMPAIRISTGPVETQGTCLRMPLRWEPEQAGTVSSFAGALELTTTSGSDSELAVFGRYSTAEAHLPPLVVMDATRATARRLLRALAMELGRRIPALPTAVPAAASLLVRDLMTAEPVTVLADAPLHTACMLMLREQIGGMPVVDRTGAVVGVLSESDLLAREAAPRRRSGIAGRHERARRLADTAGEACTRPAVTVAPDTSVREAARILLDEDISRLVVLDGARLAGVLSRHDVLRALARTPAQLQEEVDAAVDALAIHGVHAQVLASGTVRLTGTVAQRSRVGPVEHAIWSLDGVAEVRNELTWVTDDTVVTT